MAKQKAKAKATPEKKKRGAPVKDCPKCGKKVHCRKRQCDDPKCGYAFPTKEKKEKTASTSTTASAAIDLIMKTDEFYGRFENLEQAIEILDLVAELNDLAGGEDDAKRLLEYRFGEE